VVTGVASSAGASKPPVAKVKSVSPNHGPITGGTVVTITGSNLLGATAVDFGSSPGTSIIVHNNNRISATSPANEGGTVDVTVVTSTAGTSTVNPGDQFTYTGGPTIQSVNPRIGADTGGTKVTIDGTDFLTATAVDFGGVSVPFTVDSNIAISAVSPGPEADGTVDVTVSGPDGTTPIDPADHFTYASRVPIVSSIEPQSGPAGTSVTITGSRFTKKGTTVTFGGATATFAFVNSRSLTATAPAGSGTVDIIVTNAKGTSSASSADLFTYSPPA
jgi:FtsP/CotA-like multicopper oxidase with cupredoxin domain